MAGAKQPGKDKAAPGAADEPRRQSEAEELRRMAEERFDGLTAAAAAAAAASPIPGDMGAIVHELRVHQIELEMQNEELRRAQLELDAQREKYFELFDLAPVGYLTLSDVGVIGEANLTSAGLLGVERQRLVGQPLSAFVFAPDRDVLYLHQRKLRQTGEPQTCELRLRRLGGQPDAETGGDAAAGYFWARLEGRPWRETDGDAPFCRVTFSDVDAEVKAAQEIHRLNAELEQRVLTRTVELEGANKELEAFVYSASHDLRAPLRAIDGFSQMVVEDAGGRLNADDMEHLQRVRAAARRMALLIDHLIALSRTARKDLLRAPTDLSAMAESVLADLQAAQPERRVTVVVEPGLTADADAALLHVILTNLLANAWKFTSQHETARIEVAACETTDGCGFIVKDDGAGFDPAQAEHLFGAFQRYHAAEDFEGDGIGLATVQRLVAKHGGRVWAEAGVEKGATFFFTLPAASADAPG